MKNLIIICCFISYFKLSSQEVYSVLHVQGKVYKENDSLLKDGEELSGDVKLRFKNEFSHVVVLSNLQGRLKLAAKDEKKRIQNKWIYFLRNSILPKKDYTGTRGKGQSIPKWVFKNDSLLSPKKFAVPAIMKENKCAYNVLYKVDEKWLKKEAYLQDEYVQLEPTFFNSYHESVVPDLIKIYPVCSQSPHSQDTIQVRSVKYSNITNKMRYYKSLLSAHSIPKDSLEFLLDSFLWEIAGDELSLTDIIEEIND